ncbi:hypothetical protein HPULCUR_003430 [Helicostylum pulchrum]|uniref:Uncharacterized protein n=1 Tax=Helicostylum pulchrum TaxID=562976 RepID=A0ABP9XTD8_9FUNG
MASQRNNITLFEVQMLLQRTIMNESQSILGKLDNLGAAINDLREEAIAEAYYKLAERVIGRSMAKEEFDGCCEDNVNIGVLNPVMYTIKKRPLGRKMLLMRMWHRTFQYYIEEEEEGEYRVAAQTILRQEEQEEQEQEEEDAHKEEDGLLSNIVALLLDPSLENPIVEGPLLERAEGEAATKAIKEREGDPRPRRRLQVYKCKD